MAWDILIRNIKGLVQTRDQATGSLKGEAMATLPVLENAYLIIHNFLIEDYGSMDTLPAAASAMWKTPWTARSRHRFSWQS